jgi:NAD(P)-dependent dehydrogenase (short-subunit alcohol dehydrogenase family)
MKSLLAAALALLLTAAIASGDEPAPAPAPQKAILVTGASTGIGRKVTERLAADGYFVYAGARKDKDIAELSAIKNVEGIRLDVTKPEEIAVAVATITKEGRGLYGLVNNAGVAITGSLIDTEEKDFDFLMQINTYGPFRVTRAFIPLITREKGRVVNIGSISGILARPLLGVYSMSKHSIESYTDTLAEELAPSGVGVSVIEPGNYRSEITSNMLKHMGNEVTDPKLKTRLGTPDRIEYREPDEVADAVKRALSDAKPQRRYMVVPNQQEAEITIQKQIQQLVQLNDNQPYAYSREALIAMLDAALAEAKSAH